MYASKGHAHPGPPGARPVTLPSAGFSAGFFETRAQRREHNEASTCVTRGASSAHARKHYLTSAGLSAGFSAGLSPDPEPEPEPAPLPVAGMAALLGSSGRLVLQMSHFFRRIGF